MLSMNPRGRSRSPRESRAREADLFWDQEPKLYFEQERAVCMCIGAMLSGGEKRLDSYIFPITFMNTPWLS